MMTPEQLSAIQARADAATAGPWYSFDGVGQLGAQTERIDYSVGCDGIEPLGIGKLYEGDYSNDLRFIAHARADIPALLDEVRRLRELCAECIESIDDWAVYASPHFREKYGLDAEIEGYKARLNGAESEGG